MNDDSPPRDKFERHSGKIIVAFLASLTIPTIAGFVTMRDTGLANAAELRNQRAYISANEDAIDRNDTNLRRFIAEMRESLDSNAAQLREAIAASRLDPFTGTEGQALERRIDRLEWTVQSIDQRLQHIQETVDTIAKNGSAEQSK